MFDTLYDIFYHFSEYIILFLELVGVVIIFTGAVRTLVLLYKNDNNYGHREVKIMLGEALALGLEFKMGAEIVHTLFVSNLNDIIMLAFVAILRIVLSFVIHWEVKQAITDHEEYQEYKEK